MKLLKDGDAVDRSDPMAWKIDEFTCAKKDRYDQRGCGAVWTIGFDDLLLLYYEGTHTKHYYAAIKCPQCGKYNNVGKISLSVWRALCTSESMKTAIFDGLSEAL